MVAPRDRAIWSAANLIAGGGVPCLMAVFQKASGNARNTALAWRGGVGRGAQRHHRNQFKRQCETDLSASKPSCAADFRR